MENASKALIIAGSVLIALLIIGALILMFNSLSSYQNVGIQEEREAQVIEFNNQYTTYLRKDVRGSDMISLMNRIVDYNTRKGNNTEEQYEEMAIEINGIDVKNLKYNENDTSIVEKNYTQDTIGELLTKVQALEKKYQLNYITTLSANISEVMESEEKAAKLVPKQLNSYGGYATVKTDTASYYQYSQFKRVHFNCDTGATKYNSKTGRIIAMKFTCTNRLN